MNKSKEDQLSSPIKFPCDFVVKVMGKSDPQFETRVLNIMRKHFPDFGQQQISKRPSKDHNYLSLSITVFVKNKQQLDILYQELSAAPEVLVAL